MQTEELFNDDFFLRNVSRQAKVFFSATSPGRGLCG